MGRTGQSQDEAASAAASNAQAQQLNLANADEATYNSDLGTLKSGQNIGANPFATPAYLQNENTSAATAAGSTANAAKASIADTALRTGDNSASNLYAIKNNQRTAQQNANTALLQQHATDYLNNLNYQQGLLGEDLGTAPTATNLYGSATSGLNSANSNLTQLGLASYGPINSLIGAAGAAGSAALRCWIAAEVFDGWDDPRTHLVRNYIFARSDRGTVAKLLARVYLRFGERAARVVRAHRLARMLATYVFTGILRKARTWADGKDLRPIAA